MYGRMKHLIGDLFKGSRTRVTIVERLNCLIVMWKLVNFIPFVTSSCFRILLLYVCADADGRSCGQIVGLRGGGGPPRAICLRPATVRVISYSIFVGHLFHLPKGRFSWAPAE